MTREEQFFSSRFTVYGFLLYSRHRRHSVFPNEKGVSSDEENDADSRRRRAARLDRVGAGRRARHQTGRQPRRRGRAAHTRRARRRSPTLHGVPHRRTRELAPRAARDAHLDALRRHAADTPRADAEWCAHAAHILPRPRHRRALPPEGRLLLRLFEGRGRQRVLPVLSIRHGDRRRDAFDRRQVAKHRRGLVARRRPARLRLDAAQRHGR